MENVSMKQLTLFLFTLSICTLVVINKPPTQTIVKENIPVIITKKISVSEKATNVANKETIVACLQDVSCNKLAEAIIFEARGEPDIGKAAVAYVILNRMKDSRWPNKIVDVIKQPHQFSYLKDKHKQSKPTADDWDTARKIAYNTISGYINSPVGDATHYHATRVKPKWAKKLEPVAKIGQHIFYR